MTFEAKDCSSVGVVRGEGLGVGPGVGVGDGEGVACCDTFHVHLCIAVPFLFVVTAVMFHIPTAGLIFV